MRSQNLLGLSFLAMSLFACANGSKFNGGGSGGDGANGGSNGGTTATSTGGATTTSMGGTTTTSMGGTTTTTTPCNEAPCKLVNPQCGCAAGEMCALDNTGARACHAEGDTTHAQPCSGLYSCVPGELCVQTSSSVSLCSTYCDNDSQCGGGVCLITLTDPANPNVTLDGVTLCTDDCSPLNGSGCPAGLGLGCGIYQEQTGAMRLFTLCHGTGNVAQGGTCTLDADCAAGSGCFTVGMVNQCLKYCNFNSPSCPGATTCQDLKILHKGIEYGACL